MYLQESSLAADNTGNVFVCDFDTHKILKVDIDSGRILDAYGNGSRQYTRDGMVDDVGFRCHGLALFGDYLYIGDSDNLRIYRLDLSSRAMKTIAGPGRPIPGWRIDMKVQAWWRGAVYYGNNVPATEAIFGSLYSLDTDLEGNVIVADAWNRRIRKVEADTMMITTVAGNGLPWGGVDGRLATKTRIGYPDDVAVDHQGNLYIVDSENRKILKIDNKTNRIWVVAGITWTGSNKVWFREEHVKATESFINPSSVAITENGDVLVTDNDLIRRIDVRSGVIATVNVDPTGVGVAGPSRVATNARGDILWTDTDGLVVAYGASDPAKRILKNGEDYQYPHR